MIFRFPWAADHQGGPGTGVEGAEVQAHPSLRERISVRGRAAPCTLVSPWCCCIAAALTLILLSCFPFVLGGNTGPALAAWPPTETSSPNPTKVSWKAEAGVPFASLVDSQHQIPSLMAPVLLAPPKLNLCPRWSGQPSLPHWPGVMLLQHIAF